MDIRVIVNWFGSPLPYFQLWLDSCGYNKFITWIFITDIDMNKYDVPTNVKVKKTSFDALKTRLEKEFSFPVRYRKSWDFCAFRPLFGVVFAEELKGAHFWGWCDCDVIFGDLARCVDACQCGFDKIMPKGHFSLVKNDSRLNTFIRNHALSKKALDLSEAGLPCFDEVAFPCEILSEYGARQFSGIPFLNTACRCGNYVLDDVAELYRILKTRQEDRRSFPFVATWHHGKLYAHFAVPTGEVRKIEVAYFHFFRRELIANVNRLDFGGLYLIRPNEILEYDGHDLSWCEIKRMDRFKVHWRYFAKRLNWRTFMRKCAILLPKV